VEPLEYVKYKYLQNTKGIANEDLTKFAVGQTTNEHLGFIDRLALLAAETQQDIEDKVVQHDVEAQGTFDGGFKQLVQ